MSESLGDQYDPFGRHLDDPYPFYLRAQREMPIFFSSKLDVWVVTRLADVKKVLRDELTFSSVNTLRPLAPFSSQVFPILFGGYPLVPVFVVMDGEQHKQRRQPWAVGFGPDRVAAVRHYVTNRAIALAEDLIAGENTAEFMTDYANPLPVSVICHMMGYAPEHHNALGEDTRRAATLAMGHLFSSDDEQVEAAESLVRSQQLIGRYVAERMAAPRDDLISEAVAAYAPGGGPLAEEEEAELVATIFGVTLAGHINSSALLGTGVLRLLKHPEQWRLLCDQPDLIPNAIEEIFRFCTPGHIFLRQTTQDTILAGQELPAEAEVAVLLAAANRDEAAFDRPAEFDITRKPRTAHVAFGHGPHFCPAAGLGRLELEISLHILTERLPKLRLIPGQPATSRPSLASNGPFTVPVTW
jgi:cytochrome P450